MASPPGTVDDRDIAYPRWFSAFLDDRAIRKPSPHTAKAYRQDFMAIATLLAGDPARVAALTPRDITKDAMRTAFAAYADTHEAASIRRCWSTWNTLCAFFYTSELIGANPMPLIGRVDGRSTCLSINSESPVCSANSSTGTRPAADTRFCSSNTADPPVNVCDDCTENAFRYWVIETSTILIVPVQKAFSLFTRRSPHQPIHGFRP